MHMWSPITSSRCPKKAIYALRLLESILSDESRPAALIFSHDISGVLSKHAELNIYH